MDAATTTAVKIDPTRMVVLDHDFDATMSRVRERLTQLATSDKDKPITLVISSFGGSVAGLQALMDRIHLLRQAGIKIHGYVEGYAMSAGLILLQACDRRIMGPHAKLMAHGITMTFMGGYDIEAMEARLAEAKKDTAWAARLFAARTGRDAAEWEAMMQSNDPVYYRAEEALALGLVDEVLGGVEHDA